MFTIVFLRCQGKQCVTLIQLQLSPMLFYSSRVSKYIVNMMCLLIPFLPSKNSSQRTWTILSRNSAKRSYALKNTPGNMAGNNRFGSKTLYFVWTGSWRQCIKSGLLHEEKLLQDCRTESQGKGASVVCIWLSCALWQHNRINRILSNEYGGPVQFESAYFAQILKNKFSSRNANWSAEFKSPHILKCQQTTILNWAGTYVEADEQYSK